MMNAKLLVASLALGLPLVASAQFDTGGATSAPWKGLKLNAKTRIKLDFKNAGPDMIISLLSKSSGVTIVKDPNLKQPLTVSSPKPVSLDEAFQIFSTVLSLAGFDFKRDGTLMVIRKRAEQTEGRGGRGAAGAAAMMGNMDLSAFTGGGDSSTTRTQLKVYPIKNANSAQVARVINDVFSTQQQQNQGGQFQFGGMGGITFGGGRFGGGGNNNQGNNRNRQQQTVRASSDDYSNTVIVNAPSREQDQVEDLIKQLDKPTEQPQQSKVYKLVYATATEMAPTIQNVLVSNAPRGRGGQGNQNVPFEQRFQQAIRLGGTQASFGTVAADVRTNSVVVTATEENLKLVEQVIKELDTEVQIESSTFVIPLENARADQLSAVLGQAFGQRTGTNNNRNNQNFRAGNNNNFRMGGGGGGFGGGGGGFGGGGNNQRVDQAAQANALTEDALALNLADPNAEHGPLATSVEVAQGFQIFGGQNNQNRQTPARDTQGRIVNSRDLQGQISVIPDQNTNSLIIVATPENADLVRRIIEQLDKIPEQVMIETLIVEATLDASSKLGVEWKFTDSKVAGSDSTSAEGSVNFGLPVSALGQGFRYTLTGSNFEALISALKTDTKFEVLSTPRIFTSNNTQAEINISQQVPYVLSQREDANGNLTFNYAFQDVGIVLTVTPRITSNGTVTMDVTQTANDLQGFTDFNAPIVNQRQAQTTVSVRDGETIILGGIIRTQVNSTVRKVPLLGDIPLLGELFKSTDKSKSKTELLVFLTPRIVRSAADAQKERERNQAQLSPKTQKSINETLDKGQTGGKSNP